MLIRVMAGSGRLHRDRMKLRAGLRQARAEPMEGGYLSRDRCIPEDPPHARDHDCGPLDNWIDRQKTIYGSYKNGRNRTRGGSGHTRGMGFCPYLAPLVLQALHGTSCSHRHARWREELVPSPSPKRV